MKGSESNQKRRRLVRFRYCSCVPQPTLRITLGEANFGAHPNPSKVAMDLSKVKSRQGSSRRRLPMLPCLQWCDRGLHDRPARPAPALPLPGLDGPTVVGCEDEARTASPAPPEQPFHPCRRCPRPGPVRANNAGSSQGPGRARSSPNQQQMGRDASGTRRSAERPTHCPASRRRPLGRRRYRCLDTDHVSGLARGKTAPHVPKPRPSQGAAVTSPAPGTAPMVTRSGRRMARPWPFSPVAGAAAGGGQRQIFLWSKASGQAASSPTSPATCSRWPGRRMENASPSSSSRMRPARPARSMP